jgi:hypothetical protein
MMKVLQNFTGGTASDIVVLALIGIMAFLCGGAPLASGNF